MQTNNNEVRCVHLSALPDCPLSAQVIPMGRDYTIAVHGGSLSHVGSVVMSFCRQSLTGNGKSVTSSVINGLGHKDEAIARMFAEAFAVEKECTAVCACGIHIDAATPEQLAKIKEGCQQLLQLCLAS